MMIANLGLSILFVGVFMVSKGGFTILENCRGRYELFYSFDYFYKGGYFTQSCFHSTYYCHYLIVPTIIDMILIFKIIMEMKSHTKSASDLLTSNALKERKR